MKYKLEYKGKAKPSVFERVHATVALLIGIGCFTGVVYLIINPHTFMLGATLPLWSVIMWIITFFIVGVYMLVRGITDWSD